MIILYSLFHLVNTSRTVGRFCDAVPPKTFGVVKPPWANSRSLPRPRSPTDSDQPLITQTAELIDAKRGERRERQARMAEQRQQQREQRRRTKFNQGKLTNRCQVFWRKRRSRKHRYGTKVSTGVAGSQHWRWRWIIRFGEDSLGGGTGSTGYGERLRHRGCSYR